MSYIRKSKRKYYRCKGNIRIIFCRIFSGSKFEKMSEIRYVLRIIND